MVSHIGRYLCFTLAYVIGGAILALWLLDALFSLIGELAYLSADYNLINIGQYLFSISPARLLQLLPFAILLGTVWTFNQLAERGELVAMRALGMSKTSMFRTALVVIVGYSALAFTLTETIIPNTQHNAISTRAEQLGKNPPHAKDGYWLRDRDSFVHIGSWSDSNLLNQVHWFTFDGLQLTQSTSAARAEYKDSRWTLYDVRREKLTPDRDVTEEFFDQLQMSSAINPQIIRTTAAPEQLSTFELYNYSRYQRANNIAAGEHLLTFWRRVATPVTYAVMVLVAMVFAFYNTGRSSGSTKIILAVIAGVVINMVEDIAGLSSLVYQYNPLIAVSTPLIILGLSGWRMLKKI